MRLFYQGERIHSSSSPVLSSDTALCALTILHRPPDFFETEPSDTAQILPGDLLLALGSLDQLRAHAEFRRQFLHREHPSSCPVLSVGAVQHGADHTGVSECGGSTCLGLLMTVRDLYGQRSRSEREGDAPSVHKGRHTY